MAKIDPFRSANPTDPDVYPDCSKWQGNRVLSTI